VLKLPVQPPEVALNKLRALQYFVACASEGSLSRAAASLGVSVPAVAKLVGALERSLNTRFFERSSRGLALTASGAAYLEACEPALAELAEADEQARSAASRVSGTVVVAVQHVIAQECLGPALGSFRGRYPEIQLDLRDLATLAPSRMRGVDVFLTAGWPEAGDLIHRRIGTGGFVVCAAPGYWAKRGMPQRPRDLEDHDCLLIRNPDGTVLDLWNFARGAEKESVAVRGWLVTSNAQRDVVVRAAVAGEGVVRVFDWTDQPEMASGALVPALLDWTATDAPPVNLLYRASVRRVPRVRVFIDFITAIFRGISSRQRPGTVSGEIPRWRLQRHYERASAVRGS
jgi:LysR family transcriptional regulator for bpeEF and oprC